MTADVEHDYFYLHHVPYPLASRNCSQLMAQSPSVQKRDDLRLVLLGPFP
jgi:hypothetical protein